jgi:hypothetical protein
MKNIILIVLAVITGFSAAFYINRDEAVMNLKYKLNLYDRAEETADIEKAVELYNKYSASFYNTAGYIEGLSEIPAAPLVKRRLFKDINMLKGDGFILVFDKDSHEVKKTSFMNRVAAVAETDEVWMVSLQDIDTRKPEFNVKASVVKVRYMLHKEPFPEEKDQWIIYRADVYPDDEEVPQWSIEPVL